MRKTRVLIVDDSAIVRKVLADALAQQPDMEVVGSAPDPYIARDKILAVKPDVLTLDIEMPRMDGVSFLRKLMEHHPIPVIVISSLAQNGRVVLEAMQAGAVEVLPKPGGPYSVGDLATELPAKVRAAAAVKLKRMRVSTPRANPLEHPEGMDPERIVAIGASTGGTEAIREVLQTLPAQMPPIVIAQHIPAGFSRAFADRMNNVCKLTVREAVDGDHLIPGLALIAPGDHHLTVRKDALGFHACVRTGPKVCYQRPSVDVLFSSVADAVGGRSVAALLTGMGSDGASGMLKIHQAGGHTIAQDEETCAVFGMPREAIKLGAASQVLALHEIAASLFYRTRKNREI
jgi:two-component system chemotaxis response regulator CheB